MDTIQNIYRLNEMEMKVLCFYAFRSNLITMKDTQVFFKKEGITESKMEDIQSLLIRADLLAETFFSLEYGGFVISISPVYCFSVCVYLLKEHPDWLAQFRQLKLVSMFQQLNIIDYVEAAMQDTWNDLGNVTFTPSQIPYLQYSILHPDLYQMALHFDATNFYTYFTACITMASERDQPIILDRLGNLLESYSSLNKLQQIEMRELLSLYRYYGFGEYTPNSSPCTVYGFLQEGARACYQQKYDVALNYYANALKLQNKISKVKNVLPGSVNGYLLIMTYVKEGSEESLSKIKTYLNKRTTLMPSQSISRCIGRYFLDAQHDIPDEDLRMMLIDDSIINSYWAYLFGKYVNLKDYEEAWGKKSMPQSTLLKHELSAYLPLTQNERAELAHKMGGEPLLTSIYAQPRWELLLDNLLKLDKQEKSNSRLMYVIDELTSTVSIREQNMLKSGMWGAGKAISQYRYLEGNGIYLDDVDKEIQNKYLSNSYMTSSLDIEDVLPYLVGSERVYTGRNAPFKQVKICQEKPYLILDKEKNQFYVRSNYQSKKKGCKVFESSDSIIIKQHSTLYTVYPMSSKKKAIFDGLLHQQYFPLEAEDSLKNFFQKVKDQVEVHSDIIEDINALEEVDGKATICIQIHPNGMFFSIQLFAKPIENGKSLFTPGKEDYVSVDEVNGKRFQVKRHLVKEKRNYETLVDFIEENCDSQVVSDKAELGIDQLLVLLEYVYYLSGDAYCVEWPQGESFKLKSMVSPRNWNVRLTSQGDWFDLEGDICLDDNTVLSMTNLLELIGNNQQQYIRLNEHDFLILSKSLRNQLNRLEAVSIQRNGKVQISPFLAGMLGDEALNGEITVQCDKRLNKLRQCVANSQMVQPEVPKLLNATLRPYQVDGFQWLVRLNSWGAGACLADDMGLGKTLQTIAYLLYMADKGASLVVAPTSLVLNWQREIDRFAPTLRVVVLNECSNREDCILQAQQNDIVLTSYGLLITEDKALQNKQWNVICLDEAHTIKNRDTQISAEVMKLQGLNKVILTGTPIQNHLGELWNLFQFINPGLLGSYEQFSQKFIIPIEQHKDKQRQLQLNRLVHPFMLRRIKNVVIDELPDKEEIVYPVDLSQEEMEVYEAMRLRAKQLVEEGGNKVSVAMLSEITKLRQAACCVALVQKKWKGQCSKIEQLIELMNELKDGENRVLIFSQFTSFFQLIRQVLDKNGEQYLYLDGSVSIKEREKLVAQFQCGAYPFFLISLKAGGVGLNLTGANYVIHLDPWWNPAVEQQATDRAYRIGQTQKVTSYHLIARHTIEEKIIRLHQTKRNLADALLNGTDMSHKLTAQELVDILEIN